MIQTKNVLYVNLSAVTTVCQLVCRTYPYRLASGTQDGALSFYNLVSDGVPKHLLERQTRPDQTCSGLGFDPRRPTRFANPDQTETHPLGKDARHETDASLGQGCIKTHFPLRLGRPYLDRGECNDTYPYRLASAVYPRRSSVFLHMLLGVIFEGRYWRGVRGGLWAQPPSYLSPAQYILKCTNMFELPREKG